MPKVHTSYPNGRHVTRVNYLEYGRHVARLRRRRRAYAPTSNTASHDNHEKINSWVSFSFLYEYGAPFGGPLGRRSSAIISSFADIQIRQHLTARCANYNAFVIELSFL